MTTHDDNNATTWRDLADRLTPEQRTSFETSSPPARRGAWPHCWLMLRPSWTGCGDSQSDSRKVT